jgi:hypothetical protein
MDDFSPRRKYEDAEMLESSGPDSKVRVCPRSGSVALTVDDHRHRDIRGKERISPERPSGFLVTFVLDG